MHIARTLSAVTILAVSALLIRGGTACGQEPEKKTDVIKLADGKVTLPAPKQWQRRQPRTRIVEHEFAAPPAEGDEAAARITLMRAGGGVEANIQRWIGQFVQPDGGASADKTKQEKSEVSGAVVHVVDISGTYKDRQGGGPFSGGREVRREKYRMLGAIIATENSGHYFIKVIGPAKTVAANEKPFREMLKGLKVQS